MPNEADVMLDRVPPHSLDIEAALLGEMLSFPDAAIPAVMQRLRAEDFYLEIHRVLYSTLTEMWDRREPIELATVEERLRAAGRMEVVGGREELIQICDAGTSVGSVPFHTQVVKEKSVRRRLMQAGANLSRSACDSQDLKTVIEQHDTALMDLRDTDVIRSESLSEIVKRLVDRLGGDEPLIRGMRTGFTDLDKLTGGFHAGELIILASRPGYGKSALACNLVENIAADGGKVALMSLEMASEELGLRFLASKSGVDLRAMRTEKIGPEGIEKLRAASDRFAQVQVTVEDCAKLPIGALRARVRQLVAQKSINFVVVDYLQLIEGTRRHGDNREQEVASISRNLKLLARECNIPVLAVAALRRLPPGQNQRPTIQDLRESGSQEQDADEVLLLDRPSMRLKRDTDQWRQAYGKAFLEVAKQRNGPMGVVELVWRGDCVRFDNAAKDPVVQMQEVTSDGLGDYPSQTQEPTPDEPPEPF